MVDIVDHRGHHGAKYGCKMGQYSEAASARGETIRGSVKHIGDGMNSETRRGRQLMQLRLDLVPRKITDIVFVLSAANARDLSRFTDLTITMHDSDGKEALMKHSTPNPGSAEAVIMSSIYRAGNDNLWCVNSMAMPCRGTSKDYNRILSKLLDLGYPRCQSLKQLKAPILDSMRDQLGLPNPVKETEIRVCKTGLENFLQLRFAIELFHGMEEKGAGLVDQIAEPDFKRTLAEHIREAVGERFTEDHIVVDAARVKRLDRILLQLCWKYRRSSRWAGCSRSPWVPSSPWPTRRRRSPGGRRARPRAGRR